MRAASSTSAPSASSAAALAAAIVAPQPSASKPTALDAVAPYSDADAREVRAGRRPGDAVMAAVDGDAARVRMTQVLFEALVGHRRRV